MALEKPNPYLQIRTFQVGESMSTAAIMDQQEYSGELHEAGRALNAYVLEEPKDATPSIWRSLTHLKLLLPYIGRVLPILEGSHPAMHAPAAPAVAKLDLSEVHTAVETVNRGFLDLQVGNRKMRTQVQEQSIQLKRIEDQLLRTREATERNTMEQKELVEDLRSASKLIRGLATVLIVLMVVVLALVAFMLTHWHR